MDSCHRHCHIHHNRCLPDLHYHHLVMKLFELQNNIKFIKYWANPISTITLLPVAVFPSFLAVLYLEDSSTAFVIFLAWMVLFLITYFVLIYVNRVLALVNKDTI